MEQVKGACRLSSLTVYLVAYKNIPTNVNNYVHQPFNGTELYLCPEILQLNNQQVWKTLVKALTCQQCWWVCLQ